MLHVIFAKFEHHPENSAVIGVCRKPNWCAVICMFRIVIGFDAEKNVFCNILPENYGMKVIVIFRSIPITRKQNILY